MRYCLKNVKIINKNATFHQQNKNIWIENGYITHIENPQEALQKPTADDKVIEATKVDEAYCVSIGWFDMCANFQDPGQESKETLRSGLQTAMQAGFTEVCLQPNTNPVVQTKSDIAYLTQYNASHLTTLHPIAAITQQTNGKDLNDMIDLYHAGAVAFSDGNKTLWNTDLLLKTLQYLQPLNALLIQKPNDALLSQFGLMNEGIVSTQLGMKGIPHLAEEICISRDIDILRYVGGKLHFNTISSSKSLKQIKAAQEEGLAVTCDVAAHQLCLDDSFLASFDTRFKVFPPLRTQNDIKSLWEGLEKGIIGVVVSDHQPQDEESKQVEFDMAEFGASTLDTTFAALYTYSQQYNVSLTTCIEAITSQPRSILSLPIPTIEVGAKANLTVFSPKKEWVVTPEVLVSNSKHNPFLRQTLQGKAIACFNNKQAYLAQ
ncbi:MAG: dihydroorotase [Cytophagales bacterium]|nr:MAG: dihydroorotase [Cytophagales bacterium]